MESGGKLRAGRPGLRRLWFLAAGAALVAAACGSSSTSPTSSSSGAPSGSNTIPSGLSINSFGTDVESVMSPFKPLVQYATKGASTLQVGVILPDTTSSSRYVDFDAPYLTSSFADAGYSSVQFRVDNAQGSDQNEINLATADMNLGAKVLVVDPLDGPTGIAIAQAAAAKGVTVIAYDRAIFPSSGKAYYVSFDNFVVGQTIGQNFMKCAAAENVTSPQVFIMDGGKDTDPNAISFAQGYDSAVFNQKPTGTNVLAPGTSNTVNGVKYTVVQDAYSPGWSVTQAATIFQQAYTAHPNINAVITANDEMNAEVVTVLKKAGVTAGTVPTTGQDATPQAMANILEGWQCGTVYKPIYLEAEDAVAMATILLAGDTIPSALLNSTTTDPADSSNTQPASLLTPVWVDKTNMESTVVKDGFDTASTICALVPASVCSQYGIK